MNKEFFLFIFVLLIALAIYMQSVNQYSESMGYVVKKRKNPNNVTFADICHERIYDKKTGHIVGEKNTDT